jgi:hypothetical protein
MKNHSYVTFVSKINGKDFLKYNIPSKIILVQGKICAQHQRR